MTTTIGRVNYIASLDGGRTPMEARRLGDKAGKAGASGFDKSFTDAFKATLSKSAARSFEAWNKAGGKDGGTYGRAFLNKMDAFAIQASKAFAGIRLEPGFMDDFAKGFDDAGKAADELRVMLDALNGSVNGKALDSARVQVDEWAAAQRQAAEDTEAHRNAMAALKNDLLDQSRAQTELNSKMAERAEANRVLARTIGDVVNAQTLNAESTDRLGRSLDSSNAKIQEHGLHWRDLSHNQRQWTAIITAVLAGMQDIAVLGSAAGGGLIALGGAATSGVIGIGGLAAVFVTLNKELDELPGNLRPVAAEFQDFTDVFGELREEIASGAFNQMDGVFTSLGASLRSLGPEFRILGTYIGSTFRSLAENTQEGSDALAVLRKSLRLAGPNFEDLAGSAGTFGTALLRSFNRGQPLVEDLIGYLDTLANRFDDFTRSNGFDEWMRNTQDVFASLGPLLDATGRALNDLVTPESVARTTAFLDNLTEFMPNFERLLNMLGSLDAFGVLAQLLNDLGRGFAPLAPAATELALALSDVAMTVSGSLGDALLVLSTAIAPIVQQFANLIAAIPPEWWGQITTGVLAAAAAFAVINGVNGISAAMDALNGFIGVAGKAGTASGKLGALMSSSFGKAGAAGLAVVGALALTDAVTQYTNAIVDIPGQTRELVASNSSLAASFEQLNPGMMVDDWDAVLSKLDDAGGVFNNIGLAFDETGSQALALAATLGSLDADLAALAGTNIEAAIGQFQAWAKETGATDAQIQAMLNKMPQFQEAIANSSLFVGELATQEEIAAAAMGEGAAAADVNSTAIQGMGTSSYDAAISVQDLSDKIAAFGEQAFASRDAEREYEAAIDDLTASLQENGATLDITTEAGRNNQQALDDLAQAAIDHTQATLDDTKSAELARAEMEQGRAKLVEMAQQFGLTEAEAQAYADQLGLIPEDVLTDVELQGIKEAEAALAQLVRRRTVLINAAVNGGGYIPGVDRPMATGGILTGPTRILAGEAGDEAIVPLNRNLNLVDPSVRWLSAIAQGKTPAFAGGGIVGGGKTLNVDAGAIVVQGSNDPMRAGNEVLGRLVEYLGG